MLRLLTLTPILAGFASADNRVFGGLGDRKCQACLAGVEDLCRGPIASKQYNDCFCAVGEDGEAWAKLKGCITVDDGSCADDEYNVWSYWGAHCFAYKDDEEEEVCVDSSQEDGILMSVADSFCTEFLTLSASASASASADSSRSSATAAAAPSTEREETTVTEVETETSTPATTSTTTVAPTPSNTDTDNPTSGGSDDDDDDSDGGDDSDDQSGNNDSKNDDGSGNGDQKDGEGNNDDEDEDGGAGTLSPFTVGGASMAALCVSGVMMLFF